MDEMLKKQDVLDAIYETMEKTDKPDVILGLAAAMSTVKQMQAAPVNPAEKQEPCKYAISRQAVLDKIKEVCFSREQEWVDFRVSQGSNGQRDLIIKFIEDLPSVQLKPKTGHWIDHQEDRWIYAKCSECETVHDSRTNYCPNCGSYNGGGKNDNG